MQRSIWQNRFVNGRVYTDNAIARYDGGGGLVQNSGVLIDDSNNVTGINSLTAASITISSFTQGSVIFAGASGLLSQNNAAFYWDNTKITLGIGGAPLSYNSITTYNSLAGYTVSPAGSIQVDTEYNDGLGNYGVSSTIYYKIYAYINVGDGNYKYSTVTGPINYTTIYDFGSIDLSWTLTDTVSGYKIWRSLDGGVNYTYSVDVGNVFALNDNFETNWVTDDIEGGDPTSFSGYYCLYNHFPSISDPKFYAFYDISDSHYGKLGKELYVGQKIGIGTTSPTNNLHIVATTSSTDTAKIVGYGDGGYITRGYLKGVSATSGMTMWIFSDDATGSYGLIAAGGSSSAPASGGRVFEFDAYDTDLAGDQRCGTLTNEKTGSAYYWKFITRPSGFFDNALVIHSNTTRSLIGIGIAPASVTAQLHIAAGTTTANTAPIKLTTGSYTTAAAAGQIEWNNSTAENLTWSPSTTRYRIPLIDSGVAGLTSGRVPFATTNGRLTDLAAFTYATNRLSPTYITLGAGTATAGTAPLIFTSGTSLSSAVAGAVEFTTDDLFFTITTGAARKGFILNDGTNLTSGRVPFATTNGRLTDDADMTFATDTLTITKVVSSNSSAFGATAISSSSILNIGANNPLSGTSQIGVWVNTMVGTSAATSSIVGNRVDLDTANASFTCSNMIAFLVNAMNKGASATVTRATGIFALVPTIGGTGNAAIADNLTYSGSFFLHSTSTNPSVLSGRLGILSTGSTSAIFTVGNQSSSANGVITGTTQNGIYVDFTASSGATTAVRGISSFVRTENASFTIPIIANFLADTITKGASNTITRSAQFLASGDLTVGTNNAILADSSSFTAGNWAIILASTNPSRFSGPIRIGNQSDVGTAADEVRIGSRDVSAANSTLAIGTETAVVTEAVVSDRTLQVYINGTVYKICLKA